MTSRSPSQLRCRQIEPSDLDSVAGLLAKGFPARSRARWAAGLERLSRHSTPEPFPKLGYLLECDNSLVGVLLLIFTATRRGNETAIRGNVSSWYVEPAFRSHAPLLTAQGQKYRAATYVNVSPATHTWPLIEAQGFSRFCEGLFIGIPALGAASPRTMVYPIENADFPKTKVPPAEWQLLKDHQSYGCVSLWCETEDGGYPFIFRRRVVMRRMVPCAQLIFCRDIADLSRLAGPVGRFLLMRGMPLLIMGANGPVPNLVGRYFRNRRPMYYRGAHKPRLGDLSYTEIALFGI